jgi:microcystin-dependent protein
MADPFVAEIRMFGFNFPPKGWASCSGQLLPLSQNTALFSLLGTYYGGDGKSTFALPNFIDRSPVSQGQSTTGTTYDLGQSSGVPAVTLLTSEMPSHQHQMSVSRADGNQRQPASQLPATGVGGIVAYGNATSLVPFDLRNTTIMGQSQAHNNTQPYLAVTFCIALQGVFPPRT